MFLMAAVSGYVSWAFSSVRKVRNDVRKSWHLVEGANGQRAELVTLFVTKTSESISTPLAEGIRRAHDRVAAAVGPRGADHADRQLRSAFEAVWADPSSASTTSEWQTKVNAANVTVDEAARDYNAHVTQYEELRTSGSRKMVTEMLGFDKESYFAHGSAGGSDISQQIAGRANVSPTTSAIEAMPILDDATTSTLGLLPADRVAVTTPSVSVADFNPELFGISTAPVTDWVAPVASVAPVAIAAVSETPKMLVNGEEYSIPVEPAAIPTLETEPALAAQSALIGFAPAATILARKVEPLKSSP